MSITRTALLGLVLAATACKSADPPPNEKQRIEKLTRTEFVAEARERLAKVEARLQEVEARAADAEQETREALRKNRDQVKTQLEALEQQTDEQWNAATTRMREKIAGSLGRLETGIENLRKKLEAEPTK